MIENYLIVANATASFLKSEDHNHYKLPQDVQKIGVEKKSDIERFKYRLSDLENFFIGDLGFEKKTHAEAMELLLAKYKAICIDTGTDPLIIKVAGLQKGGEKLSLKISNRDFISAISFVSFMFGYKTDVGSKGGSIEVSSNMVEKHANHDQFNRSYSIPERLGVFIEEYDNFTQINKCLSTFTAARYGGPTGSLFVTASESGHQRVEQYLEFMANACPNWGVIESFIYSIPKGCKIEHSSKRLAMEEQVVKQKGNVYRNPIVVLQSGGGYYEVEAIHSSGAVNPLDSLLGFRFVNKGFFVELVGCHKYRGAIHLNTNEIRFNRSMIPGEASSIPLPSTKSHDVYLILDIEIFDKEELLVLW